MADDKLPPPPITTYQDAVDRFLKERGNECSNWWCDRDSSRERTSSELYPWDHPIHEGMVVIRMTTYNNPSFIELYAVIVWGEANMHLAKDNPFVSYERLAGSWDIAIPENYLEAMKSVLWPSPIIGVPATALWD